MTIRVLTGDARGWHTLELIDAYAAAAATEAVYADAMRDLLATTSDPFDRTQFVPGHFTASAMVVTEDRQHVLLIEHPTLGLWLQPGGHIERDDLSPRHGATREVLEETGLTAQLSNTLFDIDIHEIPRRATTPAHQHFDLRFLATSPRVLIPTTAEGIRAEWLTLDEAMRRTTDTSVRRMIGKLRR